MSLIFLVMEKFSPILSLDLGISPGLSVTWDTSVAAVQSIKEMIFEKGDQNVF